jgi:hypothetical protein
MRHVALIILVVLAIGNIARAAPRHTSIDVTVAIATDDDTTRKAGVDTIRRTLLDAFTTTEADSRHFHFDVSVIKLGVETVRGSVEVSATLHVVISDEHGKMLSFVTGESKVQVPRHAFRARLLPKLEQQALEDAIDGMLGRLRAHLPRAS